MSYYNYITLLYDFIHHHMFYHFIKSINGICFLLLLLPAYIFNKLNLIYLLLRIDFFL